MPAAPSSAIVGESASQSTVGRVDHGRNSAIVDAANALSLTSAGHTERPSRIEQQRKDERQLARAQVECLVAHRSSRLHVQDRRDHAQRVHRREHDPERDDDGVAPALVIGAGHDQELAGERRRAGHGEGDHSRDQDDGRERRPPTRHSTECVELARSAAPLDHADEEKHARRDERVRDREQDGAVEPEVVEREDADGDEPHLRHRRVGDHATEIRRTEGEQRSVDEPRAGEDEDESREVVRRLRELRDSDSQEAVDRRLRDDRGEHRRHLYRRLAVRERQPAVEREERRLDREGDREAEEDPDVVARPRLGERERPLRHPERDDRREHQQRARHRVDDERHRCGLPALASPHADEDVQRDEHRLERDVEEEEILRGERGDDRAEQEEHQRVVGARALPPDPERVADRRREDEHGGAREPEREAVEADRVGDPDALDPLPRRSELHAAVVEVEPCRRRRSRVRPP